MRRMGATRGPGFVDGLITGLLAVLILVLIVIVGAQLGWWEL